MTNQTFKTALVIIAKNEAPRIARLLESVSHHVDECWVADTGSSDDTVAISEACGARVVQVPWVDDFSAARNAALDYAQADWHLVLDADEWLVEGGSFVASLRTTPPDFVGQVALRESEQTSPTPVGIARSWLSRILPGPIRYEGRIHEQPVHQLRTSRTPVVIGHDGYTPEALRAKRGRNRRLLEQALTESPQDPYLMFQLGKDADVYEEHELAAHWFSRAWPRTEVLSPWRIDLAVRWLGCLKRLRRYEYASQLSREMSTELDYVPDFQFAIGDLMLDWAANAPDKALQLLDLAERAWRRCLEIGERPDQSSGVEGRGSHLAAFNLALILEGTGRLEEARGLRLRYGVDPKPLL